MGDNSTISKDLFLKRIGDLFLKSGLSGFPKDEAGQHIMLKSAVLMIGEAETLTEKEVNEKLKQWCQVTQAEGIDYGTLRRRLVDTGYLTRSKDGSEYQVHPAGAGKFEFDPAIEQIELPAAIAAAREEIERRKRLYSDRSQKP